MAKRKTTKTASGYAIFDSNVKASDKYIATSKPKVYKTKAEASRALKKLIQKGHRRTDLKILSYDITQAKRGLQGTKGSRQKKFGSPQERFRKFTRELSLLSSKYGIAIDSTGGVYLLDGPAKIIYSDDHTSGDLEAFWGEE